MTNTATATRTAAAELLAGTPTRNLIEALLILDAASTLTTDQRLAKAWTCEEIERRYDVEAAMDAWADVDDHGMTYVEALIAALPIEAVA